MKKNKLLVATIVLAASSLVVTGCKKRGGGDDPDIPDPGPVTVTELEKALKKDYSNCTVDTAAVYLEEGELEASERDSRIYFYNGFAISYDELSAEMGMNPYYYYHDYQGENYMWFDGNESAGEHDAWLKEGPGGVKYALQLTEFYLPAFLKGIDTTKVIAAGGNFYITDEAEVARLNYSVFGGVWENDIQEVVIMLNDEGYISKIYGFEEEDNDDEYFVAAISEIGTTTFDSSKLPPVPSADTVMEYWQYKGWEGPEKRIYPTSATVQAYETADRVNPRTMDIEESFRIEYSLSFGDKSGQYHYVERSDVSWKSSNEKVAKVTSLLYDEQDVDRYGRPIFVTEDGTWVAKTESGEYYLSNQTKEEYKVEVADETTLTARIIQKYYPSIVAVGKGSAEIYLVCRGEEDDATYAVSPSHGVQSNKLNVTVREVAPIDKTNAVYELKYAAIDSETGAITVVNNNEAHAENPVTVTGHHAFLGECSNSDLFYSKDANATELYLDSQEGQGGEAYLNYDFDDQQVSSLSFYYGYWMVGDKNGKKPNKIEIRTSNDGESWTTTDITNEIVNNISGENKKLCTVEFAPASKVMIYSYTNLIGGTYHFKMVVNETTFSANADCHNHVPAGSEVATTGITLTGANRLEVGSTTTYSAVVAPTNATNKTVTYESSNETVATIDSTGLVTALAAGTTTITAKQGEIVSNSITLTVTEPIALDAKYSGTYSSDVELSEPSYKAVVNAATKTMVFSTKTYTANLYLDDWDGSRAYTFRNDDGDVVIANFASDGYSFYVSTQYKSKINGEYLAGTIELEKLVPAESVKLNVSGKTANADGKFDIIAGKTIVVTASILPSNANVDTDLTWTVSNTNGSFDEDSHTFTAKTAGEVTLTATSTTNSEVKGSVTFVIAAVVPVTSITISGATVGQKMAVATSLTLTATVNPTTANDYNLTWDTDDHTIATVYKGVVTAKAVGTFTVTVRDTVSGVSASIELEVGAAEGAATLDTNLICEDAYDNNSCLYMTITSEGKMTIYDLYTEATVELTFANEFGNEQQGKPTYRFTNAEGTLVIDVQLFNKDSIDAYVVSGTLDAFGVTTYEMGTAGEITFNI